VASILHEALAWPKRRERFRASAADFTGNAHDKAASAYGAPSKAKAVAPPDARRILTVAAGAEAEQLTLAYLRYIELHGRALVEPRSRCSIATVPGRGTETKIFTFWSRRAAAEFDVFWRRYRPLYGAPGDPATPMGRP
jgi:hypothetical protein